MLHFNWLQIQITSGYCQYNHNDTKKSGNYIQRKPLEFGQDNIDGLSICFELRITVVNVICNCVCHRTIKVPVADHSKHRRIANYREQLSATVRMFVPQYSQDKKKIFRLKRKSTPVRLL